MDLERIISKLEENELLIIRSMIESEIAKRNLKHDPRIRESDASVRLINISLHQVGVRYWHEFSQFSENDLLKFRYFGKKVLVELKEQLDKRNIKLKYHG